MTPSTRHRSTRWANHCRSSEASQDDGCREQRHEGVATLAYRNGSVMSIQSAS